MILKSFDKVINDDRIGEVVISSDADEGEQWDKLQEYCKYQPKIKLVRNNKRLGVYGNKHASVKAATHKWVIVFDSDNVLYPQYIDIIYSYVWKEDVVFAPEFAKPQFDYRHFGGKVVDRSNVAKFMNIKLFDCLLNTMNYFVCRDTYLKVWKPKDGIIGADSIYHNMQWLKAGNKIAVLKGLQYDHAVHNGSYFQSVAKQTTPLLKNIERELKAMK